MVHICEQGITIRPVGPDEAERVLEVYRQCEDFLPLGPNPRASLEMVMEDMRHSVEEGGTFHGIYLGEQQLVGVVDVVSQGFAGRPEHAFLLLLMIGAPYRRQGLGARVVALVEREVWRNPQIATILAGVQVNNPLAIAFWVRNGYRIISGAVAQADGTITYELCKERQAADEPEQDRRA